MSVFKASPGDGAAWVTGASEGIGMAVAKRLAAQGFTVYASARSADKLESLAAAHAGPGRFVALPLDVTDRDACVEAVERIVAKSGALALAILNAGTFVPVSASKLRFEDFDKTLSVNLGGVINGLLPAINAMKEAGKGQIAIVASSAGFGGLPKSAAYGASKSGVINMAESLKFDLDRMNIRMQIVTPGFVETPLTEKNDFPMPFLMPLDKAADAFIAGLGKDAFEITFPRRLTWILKFAGLLPYALYFPLIKRVTGWG